MPLPLSGLNETAVGLEPLATSAFLVSKDLSDYQHSAERPSSLITTSLSTLQSLPRNAWLAQNMRCPCGTWHSPWCTTPLPTRCSMGDSRFLGFCGDLPRGVWQPTARLQKSRQSRHFIAMTFIHTKQGWSYTC